MNRTLARTVLAAASLSMWVALVSCGGDDGGNPVNPGGTPDVTISIKAGSSNLGANAYTPNPDTVTVGTKVSWKNNDGVVHTATADAGAFNTGNIGAGATSAPITMGTAGSFPYHCAIAGHNMTGTLVVE